MQLIFPIFLALASAQLGYASSSLEKGYDKIDRHLTKAVGSDDPILNMQEAARWLEKQKNKKLSALHSQTITALELFLKLRDLLNPETCNLQSLEVTRLNQELSRLKGSFSEQPIRRVEKIVHHYTKQHYDMCYPDKISQKFDDLDQMTYKYVMNLGAKTLSPFMPRECVRVVRENIGLRAGDEQSSMDEFSRQKLTDEDFNIYLLQPCKELKRKLGADFRGDAILASEYHDIDKSQWDEIRTKFRAIKNCYTILQFESKSHLNMAEQMIRMDEQETEAVGRAELLRQAKRI